MSERTKALILVFDSSVLSCFGRANRLETIEALSEGHRRVMTRVVKDEIERGIRQHSSLADVLHCGWLEVVQGDRLEELAAFSEYLRCLGGGPRNEGEAATLAWAEVNAGIAILDDQTGVNIGRQRGVTMKRSLSLIATGIQNGLLAENHAITLVDELVVGGARFPCDGRGFLQWCRENGLLT